MKAYTFLVLALTIIIALYLPMMPAGATREPMASADTVTFSGTITGIPLAETALKAAVPLPHRNPPRTLLNADDVMRMRSWANTYAWAASLRDQILSEADAWPAKYLSDYNLTSPDLPPEGGYSDDYYICPDGTPLQYSPTHSPPHY